MVSISHQMRTIKPSDLLIILALLLLLAIPFLLRPGKEATSGVLLPLVIISPHNEAVQYEFEHAFRQWHLKNFGQDIDIDWRNLGGTSEIARYLDSSFQAAEKTGLPGIGIDLFFGGGEYDHALQAKKGHTIPCGLRERHPEWLKEEIIPSRFSGEIFYDRDDRWYGCCLSGFGICYNEDFFKSMDGNLKKVGTDSLSVRPNGKARRDRLSRPTVEKLPRHSTGPNLSPPRQWQDLADFVFFEQLALADPTKSGSINKAFEMVIQQQMFAELMEHGKPADNVQPSDLAEGWRRAFNLIRQIGANARYFTDSAGKVTVDVAQGNAVAGMCIDFYGRFESETVERNESSARMKYIMPDNGSSISVDPISMLRGAPNRALAERFIDFCLSVDGQLIWNTRVGQPGGPIRYSLRRLPIRRDLYCPKYLENMSDPQALPYQNTGRFTYQAGWTGPFFNVIRALIRTMCIDPHDELRYAWKTINEAGGPAACPRAMAVFSALPPGVEYGAALVKSAAATADKLEEAGLMREWTMFFRNQYRKAAELAKQRL